MFTDQITQTSENNRRGISFFKHEMTRVVEFSVEFNPSIVVVYVVNAVCRGYTHTGKLRFFTGLYKKLYKAFMEGKLNFHSPHFILHLNMTRPIMCQNTRW